jgi:hypothetical protein
MGENSIPDSNGKGLTLKQQYWHTIYTRCVLNGETVKAVCANMGLNVNSVQAWIYDYRNQQRDIEAGRLDAASQLGRIPERARRARKDKGSPGDKLQGKMQTAQKDAVNTLANAAKGKEVGKQALDAAKLILSKTELLKVKQEDSNPPIVLSDNQLAERTLVSCVALLGLATVQAKLAELASSGQLVNPGTVDGTRGTVQPESSLLPSSS